MAKSMAKRRMGDFYRSMTKQCIVTVDGEGAQCREIAGYGKTNVNPTISSQSLQVWARDLIV
jgi:hypothetical protein